MFFVFQQASSFTVTLPENLSVFLVGALCIAGLGLSFFGHRKEAFWWAIICTTFIGLGLDEQIQKWISADNQVLQFFVFYLYYFFAAAGFFELFRWIKNKLQMPNTISILLRVFFGSLVFGISEWYLHRNLAEAILLSLLISFIGIVSQNYFYRKTIFHPTYPALLEETGTPIVKKHLPFIFYGMLFIVTIYMAWRFLFTLPIHNGSTFGLVLAVLLVMAEFGSLLEFIYSCWALNQPSNFGRIPDYPAQEYPDVDVFVATYNESRNLLFKTINGCKKMKYPDPKKVHIYLCDDGHRNEIRKLAEDMEVGYFTRSNNEGAKAGNLNNALKKSHSPYVVTFDADMIPRSSFLMKTIPYFIDSNKRNEKLIAEGKTPIPLGFIQTPQSFYNPDIFQYHLKSEEELSNEQDYFYRKIEPVRTNFNSVIYGGSNTILSREALESVGGFFTKAITEDFATGLLIEGNGYVSLALEEPLAAGLSPEDFPSLIQQRKRWGRGVINVLYQINLFFTRRYSPAQKSSYWSSIQYWFSPFVRLIYYLVPILSALLNLPVVNASFMQSMLFWLPYMIVQTIAVRSFSSHYRSSFWTIVYDTILAPFLFLPFLAELFGISLKKFKVTRKGEQSQSHVHMRYVWPFVVFLILNLLSIFVVIRTMVLTHVYGYAITLFWLCYNFLILSISLTFVVSNREDDGLNIQRETLWVKLYDHGKNLEGATAYLDEHQITAIFTDPIPFKQGDKLTIQLLSENEQTSVEVSCERIWQERGVQAATFKVLHAKEHPAFLQIVHDRNLIQSKPFRYSGLIGEFGRILKSASFMDK